VVHVYKPLLKRRWDRVRKISNDVMKVLLKAMKHGMLLLKALVFELQTSELWQLRKTSTRWQQVQWLPILLPRAKSPTDLDEYVKRNQQQCGSQEHNLVKN
jgi:hypothetical protein